MDSIRQAGLLNNLGVQHLTMGQSSIAMMYFNSALSIVNNFTSGQDERTNMYDGSPGPTPSSSPARRTTVTPLKKRGGVPIRKPRALHPISEITRTVPGLQSANAYYIYDRGTMILQDTIFTQHACGTQEVACYCSSAILFNWALTLQQEAAVQVGSASSSCLRYACALYTACIASLKLQALLNRATTSVAPLSLLMVAALNNKAHIHYIQFEYEDSRLCLDEISSQVDVILGLDGALDSTEAREIYLNILILQPPTGAGAA